jgi:glutamate-ammonia-ligase adenylyltransferase
MSDSVVVPSLLSARADRAQERLASVRGVLARMPACAATALRVAVASEFVLDVLCRDPEALLERLGDPAPLTEANLAPRLSVLEGDESAVMAKLRQARNIEMARIAWRDIAGWADLETTFADLSLLADCCVRAALQSATELLAPRYGRCHDGSGHEAPLLVLSMGKLGGEELNYSSDIDLVLLYPDGVECDRESVAAESYFIRLGQLLIRLLDQSTDDGFVFRVDTRLRPFGASGPLVVSLAALESYLVRHGRDWERYAYVKARLLTGQQFEADLFDEVLTPFVFRRYLDFGVFEALRQMKDLIAREVVRRDLADNIKLGPGGIREIEFIVQVLQLVRGGRNPVLRERRLLRLLPLLVAEGELDAETAAELDAAYRLLRMVENRLQAMADQQVHSLPKDPVVRAQLAYSLNFDGWEALERALAGHRDRVQAHFAEIAWDRKGHAGESVFEQLSQAWEADNLGPVLSSMALADAEAITQKLTQLREGSLYARMDEPSRQRLGAVVARLVPLLGQRAAPMLALTRTLPLLEAVGRRSAYLALLNENPAALERLLSLAEQSEFILRQIVRHPLLLDELLDARVLETAPSRDELAQLRDAFLVHAGNDTEARLEAIQQFQRAAVFRVAVADRLGGLPLMKVSDRLTDTAELVLDAALRMAWDELVARFGAPHCGDAPPLREAGFAIIGYGKLGGLELGYGSDLDLVFLHDSSGAIQETNADAPLENERFFARLAQRLIHFLSVQTSSGRLYEVDTRLRPSGRAGAMVSSLESFHRYQRKEAWVWEHQALLRSRAVAGATTVCEAFELERRDILIHHVARDRLREEILGMRQRMRADLAQGTEAQFDLKQDPGGLADIEFLVDFWVLQNAERLPELVRHPDNMRQLEALEQAALITPAQRATLAQAYLALRGRTHELALDSGGRLVDATEFRELRDQVRAIWIEVFGSE